MPDFLAESPSLFALPDLLPAQTPDAAFHNEARAQLRILNRLAWGTRGAPGLTVRSIVEDGAIPDNGVTDNRPMIQATLDAVGAAGGGIVLVPPAWPGQFFYRGTLSIPLQVTLAGLGDRSNLSADPGAGAAAIAFQQSAQPHRGGIENLILFGVDALASTGIDLSGAHFVNLEHFQIWEFGIGLVLSDGVTDYAGQNDVRHFEINSCPIGIRAYRFCNQCSVQVGRIKLCRNDGNGIGLDLRDVDALALSRMVVEDFDKGVKIEGRVRVSLRDIYWEGDLPPDPQNPDPPPLGIWMDIRPAPESTVRIENSVANVSRSYVLGGSLEDAITTDEQSHIFNGARRHHAAAPERNLFENGDFRRSVVDGGLPPAPWLTNTGTGTCVEVLGDVFTPPRSLDVTRTANANDGIQVFFHVPELPDSVTVMVRYKNLTSLAPFFALLSGANVVQFLDERPATEETGWRIAAMSVALDRNVPPAELGRLRLILTADQNGIGQNGGTIRIDEVWAVIGRTAAPSRAHSHHVELLPAPVILAARNTQIPATFDPIDLTEGKGPAYPPRGAVGALIGLRGQALLPGPPDPDPNHIGRPLHLLLRPFVQDAAGRRYFLPIAHQQAEVDRQFLVRSMTIVDGAAMATKDYFVDYQVELLGWILPS
jgi:hypothetical protein